MNGPGYIKSRSGSSVGKQMTLEIQGQVGGHLIDSDCGNEEHQLWVRIGVASEPGDRPLEDLAENAIKLTLKQARDLMSSLEKEISFVETLQKPRRVVSKPYAVDESSFATQIGRIINHQATLLTCGDDDLLKVAHDIATGQDSPETSGAAFAADYSPEGKGLGAKVRPINYLVNGAVSGILTLPAGSSVIGSLTPQAATAAPYEIFNGFNTRSLLPLAEAKHGGSPSPLTDSKLRGFGLNSPLGLSFLFSPWTDFCLLCWDYYERTMGADSDVGPEKAPRLVLGSDYYPLSYEAVLSRQFDWPVNGMMDCNPGNKAFWTCYGVPPTHVPHSNPSTRNLFDALAKAASCSTGGKLSMEQWIGRERILVYNVWPWFRSGTSTSGCGGIHQYFNKVPRLAEWLCRITDIVKPTKIAALGEWSYDTKDPNPDDWLRNNMLNLAAHLVPEVDVFYHPSRCWRSKWLSKCWGGSWRGTGRINEDAFIHFIK